jgi:hypothetical protein
MTKSHFCNIKKKIIHSIKKERTKLGEKDKSNGKQKNQNDQTL